jgi:subtilisin-like proprotein convertase family protein
MAERYPARADVSVAPNAVVQKVTLTLNGFSHTHPSDMDIMLAAPNGQNVTLMSDAGSSQDIDGVNLTFDDAAAGSLPIPITSGTYRPTNFDAGVGDDAWPTPAPAPSNSTSLASLNGINPNGTWSVFIVDDYLPADSGSLAGGFTLTLTLGYANSTSTTINAQGTASPYPSAINVSGVTGTISKVTARLNGLSHNITSDLDVLLVSPGGQSVTLMSDTGYGASNINVTFDDAAPNALPDTNLASGTYKPTSLGGADSYPAPAPAAPHGTTLGALNGGNPNGTWRLFIVDDFEDDGGSLASWSLSIETTPPPITFSAPSVSVSEGGTASLSVTRTPTNGMSTVSFATSPGTASSGDFGSTSGTLTFADGESTKTIQIPTLDNALDGPDKTFTVALSNPISAALGAPSTATVTIVDNDAPPLLSLSNASGSEAAGSLFFAYSLSSASQKPISFSVAASNGSAQIGSDFSAPAATVSVAPGSTSGLIGVPITNDALDEADETLSIALSSAVDVTLPASPSALGVIVDDDGAPGVSVNDASLAEGNSGTSSLTFTASLSAPSAQAVSVDYTTSNGSADGNDYTPSSGSLTFAPGQTSRTFSVSINGDVSIEGDETFGVTLSNPVNASLGDAVGVGTIVNDDSAQTLPAVSVSAASVTEGNSGISGLVFTVTLSSAPVQTVSVTYATSDGTAQANSDYTPTSGTLSFAPGVQSQTVVVPVIGDAVVEADESFALNLSGAGNATVAVASGAGTIANDDAAPVPTATPTATAPAPEVLLFTPASAMRNTNVIIVGLNFSRTSSVKFNGVAATFTLTSPNRIVARVPLTATSGPITITTPSGTTATGTFTVIVPPVVTAFSPAKATAGTLVTISGRDLLTANSVKFNGVAAIFTRLSATQIRATVPLLATTGKITVTSPSGTATSVAVFQVLPKINSFSSTAGAAGALVTITGSGFSNAASVKFNGVAAAFTKLSANQIRATVPAAATSGKISVTNAAGSALSLTNFTVLPKLTLFTPATGPVGTVVTITGTGLGTLTGVRFNGVAATGFTKVSATQVKATVPAGATTGKITLLAPTGNILSTTNFTVASAPGV